MTDQRVPILVYHHVYPQDAPELTDVDATQGAGIIGRPELLRQMQYLVDHGWQVVTSTRIVDWLNGTTSLPRQAVVLHFDNGWLDTVTVALPVLRDLGMTATCFPITGAVEEASCGRGTTVRTLTEGTIRKPFMTWDGVQDLLDEGWEIGAHTHTHCKVAEQHADEGDDGVIQEVQESHALFEKHLGLVPAHFAYPSGSRNDRTDALLSSRYRSLRRWHVSFPIVWQVTDRATSPMALECQNIDVRVPFDAFREIFGE
ncbi:MAG: hypothetical protein CMJ18_07430 [Phycisphaeraceae bacterium]|nr:hypothetical protein [Phycisphaeraceae bacterium]